MAARSTTVAATPRDDASSRDGLGRDDDLGARRRRAPGCGSLGGGGQGQDESRGARGTDETVHETSGLLRPAVPSKEAGGARGGVSRVLSSPGDGAAGCDGPWAGLLAPGSSAQGPLPGGVTRVRGSLAASGISSFASPVTVAGAARESHPLPSFAPRRTGDPRSVEKNEPRRIAPRPCEAHAERSPAAASRRCGLRPRRRPPAAARRGSGRAGGSTRRSAALAPPTRRTTVEPSSKVPRSSPGGHGRPGDGEAVASREAPPAEPARVDDDAPDVRRGDHHGRDVEPLVLAASLPRSSTPSGSSRRGPA